MRQLLVLALASAPALAADRFAAPQGTASNPGTLDSPWSLAKALSRTGAQPGDTLYLRGGTYFGHFDSQLTGTSASPIGVRSWVGPDGVAHTADDEWARIDGFQTTTLNGGIGTADCTAAAPMVVASRTGIEPAIVLEIGTERIQVVTVGPNDTITNCVRGWDGTTIVPHAAGDAVSITGLMLQVWGAHTTYRDFEVLSSNPTRAFADGSNQELNKSRGAGIFFFGADCSFINLVIHDASDGLFSSTASGSAVVYGNLMFNNGYVDPVRGHGQAFYMQSSAPDTKLVKQNIAFNNYASGMKAYSEQSGQVENFTFDEQISFNHGSPAAYPGNPAGIGAMFRTEALQLSAATPIPRNNRILNNWLFNPPESNGSATLTLGYQSVGDGLEVKGNYVVGGPALYFTRFKNVTLTGNTFVMGNSTSMNTHIYSVSTDTADTGIFWGGNTLFDNRVLEGGLRYSFNFSSNVTKCCVAYEGGGQLRFSDGRLGAGAPGPAPGTGDTNHPMGLGFVQWSQGLDAVGTTYSEGLPTKNVVAVMANAYEQGRGHVVVYNWEGLADVAVDLSTLGLVEGDAYAIWDAQAWRGWDPARAVVRGTYAAAAAQASLPMGRLTEVTPPIGSAFTPAHTGPLFAAFIVRKLVGGTTSTRAPPVAEPIVPQVPELTVAREPGAPVIPAVPRREVVVVAAGCGCGSTPGGALLAMLVVLALASRRGRGTAGG